jgi:glycerol-3-phosphate acyltransferase PlsY
MHVLSDILMIALAYLMGSIPFGYLLTKAAGLGDIRQIGSGNIGATNVLRTGNKKIALLTLLLDGGKGAVAVTLAHHYFWLAHHPDEIFDQAVLDWTYLAGFAAFIGHLFPLWMKFKGGKGVATAVGVITALAWPFGVGVMLIWTAVFFIWRYSSLAALVALGLAPIAALVLNLPHAAILGFAIYALTAYKHKDNIKRLLKGTELKFGRKNDAAPSTN